jgi:hypothetical protein
MVKEWWDGKRWGRGVGWLEERLRLKVKITI